MIGLQNIFDNRALGAAGMTPLGSRVVSNDAFGRLRPIELLARLLLSATLAWYRRRRQ